MRVSNEEEKRERDAPLFYKKKKFQKRRANFRVIHPKHNFPFLSFPLSFFLSFFKKKGRETHKIHSRKTHIFSLSLCCVLRVY